MTTLKICGSPVNVARVLLIAPSVALALSAGIAYLLFLWGG